MPTDVASTDAPDADPGDAPRDVQPRPATFCEFGGAAPEGIRLPPGFCARRFGRVQHARVIRFAPGGELFVTSPNAITSGYGGAGPETARIAYIADDDGDGNGESPVTFLDRAEASHALLFAPGYLYYSLGPRIYRMPYTTGQRSASAAAIIADFSDATSVVHWPITLDRSDDGTIFASRGGDETNVCTTPRPARGGILALGDAFRGRMVARGLRNPMYLRCRRGTGRCYANELTHDFWDAFGATEKLIEVRDGDDWGYPCCIAQGRPAPDAGVPCDFVPASEHAFPLHDTPFGLDFETGRWPEPFREAVIIALHGQFVSWRGARIVAVAVDPGTRRPIMGRPPLDLATGWDNGRQSIGRPSDVTFSADGRLFVANDITGEIFWIAPEGLPAR